MAALVRETADGQFEVVEAGKVVAGPLDSQIEALDAALSRNGGKTKAAILRDPDTKELNGAWRWLHATDVEDEPAYDDAQIGERTVQQCVANLNEAPLPRPINGMTADSPGHGPAGQTLANGYVHQAVEVISADGRHGAFVIAELVSDIARNLDSGRIAWASIGLGGTTSESDPEIVDAVFDHLCLTNDPAVTTLVANNAIRQPGQRFVALRTNRITAPRSRTKGTPMAKTTIRKELSKLSLRGAALDALTKLCASLSIPMEDEMSAEEWESPAVAAVRAVRMLAQAEKTLEAINGSEPAVAAAARSVVRSVLVVRAEGEPAKREVDAATADAIEKAVADGVKAEDIVAAIAALKPAPAEEEGEMTDAEKAKKATAKIEEAARSQELATLKRTVADLTEKDLAREDATWLEETIKTRGATVDPATRTSFLGNLRALHRAHGGNVEPGRKVVGDVIAKLPVAPKTRQVASIGGRDVDVTSATDADAIAKRAADLLPEIRKQHPGEDEQLLVARAQKAARSAA